MFYVKTNNKNVIIDAAETADPDNWIAVDAEWPIEYVSMYGEYLLKLVDGSIMHRTGVEISEDDDGFTSEEEIEVDENEPSETEQLRARVAELEAMLLELM